METEAEISSQALGQPGEIMQREEGDTVQARIVKDITREPRETANLWAHRSLYKNLN